MDKTYSTQDEYIKANAHVLYKTSYTDIGANKSPLPLVPSKTISGKFTEVISIAFGLIWSLSEQWSKHKGGHSEVH